MKRLVLAACLSMLAGGAWAEPREIPSEGTIELVMGQAKTFEFKDPVGEIYFAPKNVVEAQPQSDRQFTITPLTSGMTRLFVRSNSISSWRQSPDISSSSTATRKMLISTRVTVRSIAPKQRANDPTGICQNRPRIRLAFPAAGFRRQERAMIRQSAFDWGSDAVLV
ncbi:hypothetical protein ACVWY2_004343 [Bradyrhizobium sp. JR6.1]